MCNRYGNHISYRQYIERLKRAQINLVSPTADKAPNLEPRDNIFPTDPAPILRPVEGGVELVQMRWGLIPWFHKKSTKEWKMLTTNARCENITQTQTYKNAFKERRCLIPADEFYEWTGEKGKKTKWRFTVKDEEWFCFAGIWDRAETTDGVIESFALLTLDPGPDMKPYHDREPLVLKQEDYKKWLSGPAASDLFHNKTAGTFSITQAQH